MVKHIIVQFIGIIIVYFGAELIMWFFNESDKYNYIPLGITLVYIFKFRKKIFSYRKDRQSEY